MNDPTISLPAVVIKRLRTIRMSGQRMGNLVNDILDSSSMTNSALRLVEEDVSIPEVCEEVVELTRPLLKRGVELIFEYESDFPTIRADSARIKQILHNVLGNSAKFTTAGHVAVRAKFDSQESLALIFVTDTGPGIAQEKIDLIWGAFTTADEDVTRKFGGTGLGLCVAKRLALAHGGDITVRSILNEGSTFAVRCEGVLSMNVRLRVYTDSEAGGTAISDN